MKTNLGVLLLAALFPMAAYASDTVLPDACGSDKVQFETTQVKATDLTLTPVDGKARVVFIQVTIKQGGPRIFAMHDFTTRFGVDGQWAGAAGNNSYFSFDVTPGEHHICASVQGGSSAAKRMVAADSFTAEAGKVYYFNFTAERLSGNSNYYESKFTMLNPDEGKYRVKSLPVSVSTAHKP